MPRGIGASIGVNDSVTGSRAAAEGLLDLGRVLVGAADLVRRTARPSPRCPAGIGLADRPAPRRPGRGDHDHVGRLDQAGGEQRRERRG